MNVHVAFLFSLLPVYSFVIDQKLALYRLRTANDGRSKKMVPFDLSAEPRATSSQELNPYHLRPAQTMCIKGIAPRDGPLNEAVATVANLTSLEEANALIDIGAVWARMERLTEEDLLAMYEQDETASAKALYADLGVSLQFNNNYDNSDDVEMDLDQYVAQMEQQRFRRILSPSSVEAGTDLRIYPNPRRFPSYDEVTRESLIYEDTTFIVVDKPPGLPTQPDSSNYYECCPGAVQDKLGPFYDITGKEIVRPLLCHRVDACVGGCVVLSKDRNGQRVFAELQRDRKLRKLYLAVTKQPVPLGMHIHWMYAAQTARGATGGPPCQLMRHIPPESRRQARQFWNRCVLEVVKCEPIQVKGADPKERYFQNTIRLVTGRKHQVRAQLASLGCPIIRDTLYEPIAGMTLDQLQDEEQENALDQAVAKCRVPTEPIGLQAHAILFGGIRAKARPPWWSSEEKPEEGSTPADTL